MFIPKEYTTVVKMPLWWTEGERDVLGYTDAVDTYCCSLYPAWFVYVPRYDYSGYFSPKDLLIQNKKEPA